jgi:hypothetical protein
MMHMHATLVVGWPCIGHVHCYQVPPKESEDQKTRKQAKYTQRWTPQQGRRGQVPQHKSNGNLRQLKDQTTHMRTQQIA